MELTEHARIRCQQRGISGEIVDILLKFGRRKHRGGAAICFMDRASREDARQTLGRRKFARISDRLNSYVVVSDDETVITAAKRVSRLKF